MGLEPAPGSGPGPQPARPTLSEEAHAEALALLKAPDLLEGGADIRFIQAMLGHAELSTTEIDTQVSIRLLESIHTATHPGRMAEVGRHDSEPTAEDLLEALAREAEEEGEY